jgi:hypothetical protein
MDHRNQAVKNPDAFVVNKNMMRCLVKAIACHGLGLHIYAGEDLPLDDDGNHAVKGTNSEDQAFEAKYLDQLRAASLEGMSALESAFKAIPASAAKSRFWAKHQQSLKGAAK